MALLKRDAPENGSAKQEQKQAKAFDKAWNAFWATPAGRARLAYRAGNQVFQYNVDVMTPDCRFKDQDSAHRVVALLSGILHQGLCQRVLRLPLHGG